MHALMTQPGYHLCKTGATYVVLSSIHPRPHWCTQIDGNGSRGIELLVSPNSSNNRSPSQLLNSLTLQRPGTLPQDSLLTSDTETLS